MDKRYQIFVSSTYADLQQERSNVIQTIMELDCFPAGMELFPAIDDEQFNFIKRVIDDCDYYLLIIGGRYGTISEEGISYTEMEYNYAVEKGLRVIAFLHRNPGSIPSIKTDMNDEARQKLNLFKQKVETGRLVKYWENADELPGLVALSLAKSIKTYPALGWVRASEPQNPEILSELNEQRKENGELRKKVEFLESKLNEAPIVENLQDFEDVITINGRANVSGAFRNWTFDINWRDIFIIVSPLLLNTPNDPTVKNSLATAVYGRTGGYGLDPRINDEIFQTIKIQFKASSLIEFEQKEGKYGMALHWKLTKTGEKLMTELVTRRKLSS